MVEKSIVLKIARLLNYICALGMLVDACIRFSRFGEASDPFFYLLTFYLIGFAALLIIAELRLKKILVYVEFLKGRMGKGIYIIIVGLLIFDETRTYDMAISIILVIVGILNIIVSCMREKLSGDDNQNMRKSPR